MPGPFADQSTVSFAKKADVMKLLSAMVSHNVLKLGKNWGTFMAGVLPTK